MSDTSDTAKRRGAVKLRAWMTLHDVTPTNFASRLDVSRQSVHRWLQGTRPDYRHLRDIKAATGIGLDEWSLPGDG
jgi:transcriptional regulator with XRE-family HTH domain